MSQPKREAASWQAQVAFYLSIALAGFQLFQFFKAERETTIAASIDIGRKYLSDPAVMKGRYIAIRIEKGEAPVTVIPTGVDDWNQFILNIGYIAELLKKGRLDRDYLTAAVVCDIWLANEVAGKLPTPPTEDSVLRTLGPQLDKDCRPTFPK